MIIDIAEEVTRDHINGAQLGAILEGACGGDRLIEVRPLDHRHSDQPQAGWLFVTYWGNTPRHAAVTTAGKLRI